MVDLDDGVWMMCSACRKPIRFGATHWVCSVSTCNRDRTRLVFCSVSCWDSHVATLRHRDAWAVEARAPGRGETVREVRHEPAPREVAPVVRQPAPAPRPSMSSAPSPSPSSPRPSVTAHAGGPALSNKYDHDEILVVVSKVKKYIRDRSDMNTSDAVAEALGAHVRKVCDDAIRNAVRDGRKTVLDRDVPPAFPR
ncbi:MAG TPA: hypothetical protein VN903_03915 [Polyangia bacterium]|jgi:hypothetical protein|nr:hypothetical protein [Polyangia bacterium]